MTGRPERGGRSAPRRKLGYRPDIDGLRAVAVLAVLLFHAGVPAVPGGYAGVDAFFVISGYLITGILTAELAGGRLSIAGFYERRIRRILPALFAVLAVSSVAAWILLLPKDLMEFSYALRGAAVFGANFALADLVDYFAGPAELQPLLHIWSLGVEEQFYLVYPLLLWALARYAPRALVPALAALAAGSFALALRGVSEAPDNAFFLPHMRMWELLVGALLALGAVPPLRASAARAVAAALGAALLLGAFALLAPGAGFPGWPALAPVLGTALLIHAGAGGNPVSAALATRPMVGVGLISYSLYLWHWPLLAFARRLSSEPLGPAAVAGLLAASFVLAYGSWRFVERPFRRRSAAPSRRGAFVFAGCGVALFLAVGYAGKLTGGAPWRFGPELEAMLAARDAYFEGPGRACGERTGRIADAATPAEAAALACRIGAPEGPPRFVLWGDSLAMALQPAADEAGRAVGAGGLALARSACAPLPGFVRRDDRKSRVCERFNAQVLRIAALPGIDAVIVSSALQSLLRGPQGARLRALFLDAVADLSRQGKRVILVAPPPFPGFDVPTALARAARFGAPPPPGPRAEDARADQAPLIEVMEAAAALPGVRAVFSAPAFCPGARCDAARDGRVLYADAIHPSPDGARLLVPALTEALAEALADAGR